MEEALEVADRVVLMNSGKVEQIGSPQEVWDHPASPFVYGFLGDVNLFHGRAHEGEVHLVVGPIARLELIPDDDTKPAGDNGDSIIEAQIPAQQYKDMGFREGETLVVTPRRARVFVE